MSKATNIHNFNNEEWKAMHSLVDQNLAQKIRQRILVVKDQNSYLMKAKKQLSDKNVNKVNFNVKLIQNLTKTSKKIFRSLKKRGFKTDKELKYFSFDN